MVTRRRARELALRTLYAAELSENPISEVIENLFHSQNNKNHIITFCTQLIKKTYQHCDEFDTVIKNKALNWDFTRIAIMDLIILRIAMCEFLHFEDIPPKVSIDEAIEISKKYSTEKSGKFINGILDSVLSDWKAEHKIKKTGRGLISETFNPLISKSEKT